jgi:D-alanyl-lipoteichoic acid acyltransferase DltB (MBOAT superfamily)
MLFNSIHYALFFPVAVALFFATPHRWRWAVLLLCSYYFYMCWRAEYIVLVLFTTLLDFLVALGMARAGDDPRRRRLLILSLGGNLGLLFAFKYFNFINRSLAGLAAHLGWSYPVPDLHVVLPVGLSFYTFQAMSYTVDVYRRRVEAVRHLGHYALFVAFFPQMVAGPIERAGHLIPQFLREHRFDPVQVRRGLEQIGWGLFKKVVIADRAALYVDAVYNNVGRHEGWSYLMATYLFTIQIYCDFSGYSDIAIGSARVLGFELRRNFDQPYLARSITEFWRRWHMSLSAWLRDYLYIPLGGNRKGPRRTLVNLQITMLLGGLWHGASWTFVVWGGLQGILLSWERLTEGRGTRLLERLRLPAGVQAAVWWVLTLHLVCLSWIFFRANTVADAWSVLAGIATRPGTLFVDAHVFGHCAVGVLVLLAAEAVEARRGLLEWLAARPVALRWGLYAATVFGITILGVDGGAQFIYFQF